MTDSTLAFLRELERADGAAAAELEELDVLTRETETVRARATELIAFRERLPAERESRARELAEAVPALAEAESVAARAAAELEHAERSGDADRAAAARRFEVRARDERSVAERRVREARERVEQLAAEAEAAERETAELEQRAGELARALGGRPRLGRDAAIPPEPGLAGVVAWGIRARAALLVARSQLTAEQEAISRQANELASVLLGESQTAAPPSIVARRVERALGQS